MQKSNVPIKQAYTIDDTCELVKVGKTLLYEEIKKGRLIAHKVGARTLIFDRDLQAWLESLPVTKEIEGSHA